MLSGPSTLYLHLGLAKTGSTFLQRDVFPHLSGVTYFNKPQTDLVKRANPSSGAFRSFFDHSPAIWDDLGEALFTEIFGTPGGKNGKHVLVSDENVCVNLRNKRDYLGSNRSLKGRDPYTVRDHLRKLVELAETWGFERVRLLISVRRQDQWLASAYSQTSNRRPGASQKDFERYLDTLLDPASDYYINGVCLDYALLRTLLVEAVDEKHVLMLPYELMKANFSAFLSQWSQFIGDRDDVDLLEASSEKLGRSTKKVRSTAKNQWMIRDRLESDTTVLRLRPSRLFKSVGLPWRLPLRLPEFKRERKIRLKDDLRRKVLKRYEDSNRSFANAINMDLSVYGYYDDV
jgi:hypothetical protein